MNYDEWEKGVRGGRAQISWGGIFGGKRGMWRLGGDLGESNQRQPSAPLLPGPRLTGFAQSRDRKVLGDNYAERGIQCGLGQSSKGEGGGQHECQVSFL